MTDYEYYKSKKICVACRKEEACRKSVLCLECLFKRRYREQNKPYWQHEKRKKRQRENRKIKYHTRKSQGLCPQCGRKSGEYTYCYYCRKKMSLRHNKRDMHIILNICGVCGKNQRIDGKKVCEKCYEVLLVRVNKIAELRNS
jgi:hypothetical protein